MRILVVEDDKDLCLTIAKGLKYSGHAVDTCFYGNEALEKTIDNPYNLIILDLNLPQIDGLDILKAIRETNNIVKILILTARTSIEDKVAGLDLGANDYLTKPFDFKELEARVRVLLREKTITNNNILTCDNIQFDTTTRRCFVKMDIALNKTEVPLTKREVSLLEYLLLNKGRYINQTELIEQVWDESVDIFSNAIRVHISSLRKKLKSTLNYDPIVNKINEGYALIERRTNAK